MKDSIFVLKPQGSDPTRVVHGKQEIEVTKRPCLYLSSCATSFLYALRMIAEDDTPPPCANVV